MQLKRERIRSGTDIRRFVSTREGTIVVAALVALLAGAMVLLFLSQYRQNVTNSSPTSVLVAKSLIEKGSSGDVVVTKGMYETTTIKKSEVQAGAISDPGVLRGQVAAKDVYPNRQLTTQDFTKTGDAVVNKIATRERAMTVPLDSAHGMVGDVIAGDHVDVLGGFNVQPEGSTRPHPVMKTLLQNVLVLRAPPPAGKGANLGGSSTKNIVLKMKDSDAAELAFASDNGKVWLVLRPHAGAEQSRPSLVTIETILFGINPIRAAKLVRKGH
jgi:Flp pilus assembly protein CpaB